MELESFRQYCLSKPGVEETTPFGPDALVFKVGGKMFALTNLSAEELKINLKCEPAYALELRDQYPEIIPGWHMNKKHWNTVSLQGSLRDGFLRTLIDHSYDLVAGRTRNTKKSSP